MFYNIFKKIKILITKNKKILIFLFIILFILIISALFVLNNLKNKLTRIYEENQSIIIKDRHKEIISIQKNNSNYYAIYIDNLPNNFVNQLLQQEDKYFYYHLGINPISTLRALSRINKEKNPSSSTITQQLSKILLQQELKRTFKNKLKELAYALSLEIFLSKDEILKMYLNSVYLGNSIQGINLASQTYFGKEIENLNDDEIKQLLTSIQNPSGENPLKIKEKQLNQKLSLDLKTESQEFFELNSLKITCEKMCQLSIDQELSKKLREILKNNLNNLAQKNATNGAIVVIKLPENELLSVIGSPDPSIDNYGYKINMAQKPRPIGSTIKPFIYTKGFEMDLRPYSKIIDQEYKYTIGSGFAFYPKNYDYQYRGEVNLHYALSNSLNVPTVKVLEYIGLNDFYDFLSNDLEFNSLQNLENYQLGIALGSLEMDLLSLSYYFTIFPNQGYLKPLKIYEDKTIDFQTMTNFNQNKKIFDKQYIQLTNKILNDRLTSIDQFGQKSNLNLVQNNYALKTGTSREYHDSWVVGYTPDFLVGVWVGNADDTAMDAVSGSSGAGMIWQEAMNLLINSSYNQKTNFDFSQIKEFKNQQNIEYGLVGDDYEKNLNLLLDNKLITNPHNDDIFLLENDTEIILQANKDVKWFVDNDFLGSGEKVIFRPKEIKEYKIKAVFQDEEEDLKIFVQ